MAREIDVFEERWYAAWTPRLLKASYNYHFAQKDRGAYAHHPRYLMQVVYDSIMDLGGDGGGLVRPPAEQ